MAKEIQPKRPIQPAEIPGEKIAKLVSAGEEILASATSTESYAPSCKDFKIPAGENALLITEGVIFAK